MYEITEKTPFFKHLLSKHTTPSNRSLLFYQKLLFQKRPRTFVCRNPVKRILWRVDYKFYPTLSKEPTIYFSRHKTQVLSQFCRTSNLSRSSPPKRHDIVPESNRKKNGFSFPKNRFEIPSQNRPNLAIGCKTCACCDTVLWTLSD